MISAAPAQHGPASVPVLVPAPVRLGGDTARLRAEVRGFLASERHAGTFEPRCDSWLAGWDEEFSRRLGARGWLGMTVPQAVQQQVAELAAEVAAIRAAADAAVELCAAEGVGDQRAGLAVAAAKVQAGRGAGVAARIAHQVHGAIGFTQEHQLHLATTRLWAWRDEAGNEAEWAAQLGDQALAAGPDGLWPLLADA